MPHSRQARETRALSRHLWQWTLLALLRSGGQVLSRQRLEETLYGFDELAWNGASTAF